MAYCIEKTTNNGYRCGCCNKTWNDTYWVEDHADALEEVPRDHDRGCGDYELEHIAVIDGSTGNTIAEMRLEWTGGRSERYRHYRWVGYVGDERVEKVYGAEPGETWGDMVQRLAKAHREGQVAKATAELEAAKKKLEVLK